MTTRSAHLPHRRSRDRRPPGSRLRAAAGALGAWLLFPTGAAFAQPYTVSVEESGPQPTAYTKRFNWRVLSGYRHTTMVASATDPLACEESPCLDDGEPGDQAPDSTRGGTATAIVGGMQSGVYQLELRYNQTANRSTAVPWSVSTDAAANGSRSGTLDQRNTTPGASNWLVLGGTSASPIAVESSLTFVLGSDTTTFNGSLSYGGIRLVRLGDVGGAGGAGGSSAGGGEGGAGAVATCTPLRSAEYDAPPSVLDEPLGSTVVLSFTIADVPSPAGLTDAQLTMTLFDADHPGEEGLVYVNGNEPLDLPASTAWGDVSAPAVLSIPPGYLLEGTNVVELGVGSRPTTYYAASQVGLELSGPACESPADGGTGGSATGGGGASSTGGGAGQGIGASGAFGGDGPMPAAPSVAGSDGGCGCRMGSRDGTLSVSLWATTVIATLARARSRARRRRDG